MCPPSAPDSALSVVTFAASTLRSCRIGLDGHPVTPVCWSAVPRRPTRELPPGFGTIWVCVALDLVGFGIVLPILPLYAERFGARAFSATALVAAFSAAQLLFSPIWGRLSDRVGRKPILVLSL